MFSLTRAKYIEAMESATNLVWTLCLEKANLFNSEQNLSANWYGQFADENLRMFRNLLQRGAYDMSISYANGMVAVMEEYLPEIDKMMAKREKIAEQLEQDWYVEPDLSSFCEEMLILDYDYIEGIKADGEGAVYYGDKAIEILTEMIEEVNACASEYVNLSVVEELLATGKRKLHRIDNFIYEFVDFARKMSDMEYNMSQDLSMRIIKQNEEDVLSNGAGKVYQDFETRTEQIGEGYEFVNYYEEVEILVSNEMLMACGWSEDIVTDKMITELNKVLMKYDINTPERIKHFLTQCSYESAFGRHTVEQGSDKYFEKKEYGSKYRGVGYIQMTWDYAYQAFATFLVLEEKTELKNYVSYKNPACNGKEQIYREYIKMKEIAIEKDIDIKKYTDIVDKGYLYVSDQFAWECAGYYWDISDMNKIVDDGGDVDSISKVVNRWDSASFPKRRAIYERVDIVFEEYTSRK